MRAAPKHTVIALGGSLLLVFAIWIIWGASSWVERPFAGFLLLENSVVASAGLTSWPATSDGRIFQHQLLKYDGIDYATSVEFHAYVESQPIGTEIEYVFKRDDSTIRTRIDSPVHSN